MADEALEEAASASGAAFVAGDATRALATMRSGVVPHRDSDPKVLHNVVVAEYVEGGQRDPQKLLAVLEALKQRLEDARSESEFGEGAALGDADPSLIVYNIAVLQYQLKQFTRCRTLLEDMFSNIEPIDEFLAFKLCFLLLDVYLLQRQVDRAAEVLAYLERSFATLTKVDPKESGGEGEEKGLSADWPNKRSARRPPTDITPDDVRGSLSLYKAKLALMSRSSKSSKREIKTSLNACAQNTTGLFLKSNLEWQRANYRKAIKLLNNSCQTTERDANLPALYFNNLGCIHHCMRKHHAASFYFTRALQENDALYKGVTPEAGVSLPSFSCDRRCELEYNRALQLLLCGKPTQAFPAFLIALQLMHSQPRAWLRLGETCVAVHVQAQQRAATPRGEGLLVAAGATVTSAAAAASGSRWLVLPTGGPPAAGAGEAAPPDEPAAADEPSAGAPAAPAPTLAYGVKCLRNALLLCGSQLGSAPQLAAVSAAEYSALLASAAAGTLTSAEEQSMQLHSMQRLTLLHLSWASLVVDDYVPALSWASQLLCIDACPPSVKLYAHLYACDALCHLNRAEEAAVQLIAALEMGEPLSPVVSPTGIDAAAADEVVESVRNPYSPIAAPPPSGPARDAGRAALYTNLAVVSVLQGDGAQAEGYVAQALAQQPDSHQATLCAVYLQLRNGQTDAASRALKKQRLPKAA